MSNMDWNLGPGKKIVLLEGVTVTCPVYVPAVNPNVLAETVMKPGDPGEAKP